MPTKLRAWLAIVGAVLVALGVSLGPVNTASATGGGGNLDCPSGTTQVAKVNWNGSGYAFEGSANGVTVAGNSSAGTFTSTTPIAAVVVKGGTDAKIDTYNPPVTSGSFNNTGLVNNGGQTPAISNVKFCGPTSPPPVTPEGSNNSSSPSCEKITVGTPTGVKPEGATVVVKLDGVVTQPGTYDAEPGTHVVTTYVNGTKVDEDTVVVDECPQPPTEPEGSVVVVSNDCETITFSSEDVKPKDATVVFKLDGVAKPAGTYDVSPGSHTVELWVNGTKVDSETVTVKECEGTPPPDDSCPPLTGSVKTTLADGSVVNGNIYTAKSDVYVSGSQLGDVTTVYIRVTDPSGSTVLSGVKQVSVTDGSFGPVQLPTFADTPNNGGEYKVWVSSTSEFEHKCTKTDNFKVKGEEPPPPLTSVTPDKPGETTPDCQQPNKTVTPGSKPGVIWNPQGATVLKPGESVTYVAAPAKGYTFPEGAQTSWTFTNTFDIKTCATTTPTPTPTPTVTPTPTPTTPVTPTPTTPTETPTTPTETPTPEIGTPTSTSVPTPTPTSTPSVIPPHTGAGGDWTGGVSAAGGDSSMAELMRRIAIVGGLALLGLAVWPRRRKVNA